MKQLMISVYDKVACAYFPPFLAPNEAAAIRQLVNARQADGPLKASPMDYAFYVVATFDLDNGEVVPCAPRALSVPMPLSVVSNESAS